MTDTLLPISVLCPWCGQGETMADQTADIRVSCQCSICGRVYKIDFRTLRAAKARPKEKINRPVKLVRL